MVDQVDANSVVFAERRGDLELGAHTIGAGDQNRLFAALELKESAEEAEVANHFGAESGAGVLLDQLQRPAGSIDVNAGGRVAGFISLSGHPIPPTGKMPVLQNKLIHFQLDGHRVVSGEASETEVLPGKADRLDESINAEIAQ
ncbi:MAG: hypothetical protein DDT26_01854 [Dehalococcoidia bacterium]|nr:hypothetical protein [Chloroflexota bacterium]